MYTGSTNFGDENWQTEWGEIGEFIQHTSSTNTGFYGGDKYLNTIGNFGVYFESAYQYQVQPAVELYELTLNKPQYANLHQISRIMKALVFERITDIYGDVPYSQAGLGYYENIYSPAYDTQQSIYTDMLKEVSQATDSLNLNADQPTGDVFYSSSGSQIAEWKKFGNSLLLRIAMRLTKVDPTTAQSYVAKVLGNTMTSNNDNAIVEHELGSETQNRDAWSIIGNDSADYKLCSTYIDSLQKNHDPRLPFISWIYGTQDTVSADQIGMPPGYIVGGALASTNITLLPNYPAAGTQGYSTVNGDILNLTAPNIILTYAETEFLLADAAQRWGITGAGTAAQHYNNGVLAALTQINTYTGVNVTQAQAQAYLNVHPYNSGIGLSQINTQYWMCTIMDEYEAWANWRRTSGGATPVSGFPALTPTDYPNNVTAGTIPRRLEYPTLEKITNLASYNAAVARLPGGDLLTSRMWWDTK
jgi:hypothetical protein